MMLADQRGAVAVDGVNGGGFEMRFDEPPVAIIFTARLLLRNDAPHRFADSLPHLAGRFLRESDRRQLRNSRAVPEVLQIALHEHSGLAGAGPRREHERTCRVLNGSLLIGIGSARHAISVAMRALGEFARALSLGN